MTRVDVDNDATDPTAEEQVLALLRQDDPAAAPRLLEVFGSRVYALVLRILASEEDAQEAVQETFLKIWEKWPTFRGRSSFSSWIYRIAANCAYMKLRRRKRTTERMHSAELDESVEARASVTGVDAQRLRPDHVLARQEVRESIEAAVRDLSPTYRTAFVLKDLEGMSVRDIAEIMELSEAAVKSRIHRARLQMRETLSRLLDGEPVP